ncbi:hypothetical protein HMPREF0294_0571 [Corynebacterium glucuronolyticum ATCC 51867]|nr:hypothetical protein HMPREF0294_0571 [Corynebacterium glucuronolyticum ATCC 51867]
MSLFSLVTVGGAADLPRTCGDEPGSNMSYRSDVVSAPHLRG